MISRMPAAASLTLFAVVIVSTALPAVAKQRVLWSFANPNLGSPLGRLLLRDGNLYGTASAFGDSGQGQVFLLRQSGAKWAGKSIIKFDGADGSVPFAGVTALSGKLYGTAAEGGNANCGTVFSAWKSGASWKHTTIWTFAGGTSDGCQPLSDLVKDQAGNIFGTSSGGGGTNMACSGGCGAVFELSPGNGGTWTETILHGFVDGSDGAAPRGGLYRDKHGDLFGTTSAGGGNGCLVGCGVVFELTPNGSGWKFNTIHTFEGNDGGMPWAVLIAGSKETLYGTTTTGGDFGYGTVFSLTPSNGAWTESVLYSFQNLHDGGTPQAALTWNDSGALYGTAFSGGEPGCTDNDGCGVVFELTQSAGVWGESVLHTFSGGKDGGNPAAAVILDESGNLYSTSYEGGAHGFGAVWEITPENGSHPD